MLLVAMNNDTDMHFLGIFGEGGILILVDLEGDM